MMDPRYEMMPEQDPAVFSPGRFGVPPAAEPEEQQPLRPVYRPAGTRDLVFAGILAVLCILALLSPWMLGEWR